MMINQPQPTRKGTTMITFDQLLDLFDSAYAVDIDDQVLFVYLEQDEEDENTYHINLENETLTISREDNEEIIVSTYTYTINVKSDWDGNPRERDVRFLKLM
jgi:hypothetical protein